MYIPALGNSAAVTALRAWLLDWSSDEVLHLKGRVSIVIGDYFDSYAVATYIESLILELKIPGRN
jgi:hypothetical protein